MAKYILREFQQNIPVSITPKTIKQSQQMIARFESRDLHAIALGSKTLGVYKIKFTPEDRAELFDIYGYDESNIVDVVSKIPTINPSFNVVSDPFNLFVTWMVYNTLNHEFHSQHKKNLEMQKDYAVLLLKWMHYRFFTSRVNRSFPHPPNAEVMEATINSLSNKFDIARYDSWREVIVSYCEDIISPKGIHFKALSEFHDDAKILYFISDTQSRIRSKIRKVVTEFHDTKERGDAFGSYGMVSDIDGEKIILGKTEMFDSVTSNLMNQVFNKNAFISEKLSVSVSKLFKNVKPAQLRVLLERFSIQASDQFRNKELLKTEPVKGYDLELFVGSEILIQQLLQKTYRRCVRDKNVNTNSKLAILDKTKNLYSSSRISDPEIQQVKDSVGYFVEMSKISSREATNSSLRLAFITYVMIKSFEFI